MKKLFLALLALALLVGGCGTAAEKVSDTRFAMDTFITIDAYGANGDDVMAAENSAFNKFQQIAIETDRFNDGGAGSLWQLNHAAAGQKVQLAPHTAAILDYCANKNGPEFDITLGAVSDIWLAAKEEGVVPDTAAVKEALSHSGRDKIIYDAATGTAVRHDSATIIDLSAVAKGYAVDVAAQTLSESKNISAALVNGGGNIKVIGQKPDGKFEVMDISKAPHMLVAGTTGSGKTIFLYSILVSLLHQYSADELEVLIIDPKQTDFIFFEGVPHLYGGHVVKAADEALEMLQRINTVDKEERTAALMTCRSRDIESYNQKNPNDKMKRLVVVIDEYSDLIQAAEMQGNRKEFEKNLQMLLQRVRNLGIHLIIATQRPSAQIVTGALKAVIPFRVSFRLPSHTDSQTILDMSGAENLLGKGDMLMVTDSDTMRMQGLYISEDELSHFIEKLL